MSAQLHQEIASRDMRMAQYYDGTKNYGSAKTYYAEVIEKYPDSELAKQARERVTQIAGEPDFPEKRLAWFVDVFPEEPGARVAGQCAGDQERHADRPAAGRLPRRGKQ